VDERLVIDNNVVISSIFWDKGNPHKVINLAIENKISNFTSPKMLQELVKVLREKFKQPEEIIQRQLSLVANYSKIVRPNIKIKVVKDDPKDDMVLECAETANAEYIVSGDNHLLNLKQFKGIKILTPKQFLDLINK